MKEVDNKDSGEELIKREEIKNTPFQVITVKGESFGVMGDYRLTEKGNSVKAVKEDLKKITWNRLVQVIMILDEVKNKIKEEKK